MHRCRDGSVLLFGLLVAALPAQGSRSDYERARTLPQRFGGKVVEFRPRIQWLPDGGGLWFTTGSGAKRQYVKVGFDGSRTSAAQPAELGIEEREALLEAEPRRRPSRSSDEPTRIVFENRLDAALRLSWVDTEGQLRPYGEVAPGQRREQPTFVGHVWQLDAPDGATAAIFTATAEPGIARVDGSNRPGSRRTARERRESPVFVRAHDVWLRRDGEEFRLSTDGKPDDGYRDGGQLSPDGQRLLCFQVAPGFDRRVVLVESSPRDGVQPKLHEHSYRKPGDAIDRPRPRLFDLRQRVPIPVDEAPFADAWSIDRVRWALDGSEVYCLYNQRGHQLLAVRAIDANTGAVRTVLEERSSTFVDYSQKTVLHWLGDMGAFVWASERDGHNHLYLVDVRSGSLRQLTKGPFVVRSLEHVDEQRREVWFAAGGVHPDQDPYHLHLCRVGLDGSGFTVLTQGDGTHAWTFSPDRQWFIDRWSRVDQPFVTELRSARDGTLVAELGRDDAAPLLAAGFRPPVRFVAKGRDGSTDIHGILILPSEFDPSQRYPVIEDIYAGPHGQHVEKRWGLGFRQRALAELGFVVVRIDGMGTNWRSKAFHDVCWRNLKDGGFPDRIAWLRAAAVAHPFLDLDRVGIFGGSAGGQNALAALLHHGDFYKVAVSDCGCHDNRMDKIWWNEAWMGYPIGPWYADNSNVTHAGKLQGKLLLTVGELDRNVDPASTMQVANALIAADKDFELVVVPGGGHGVGETPYLVRRRQDFFVRHLAGKEPRLP